MRYLQSYNQFRREVTLALRDSISINLMLIMVPHDHMKAKDRDPERGEPSEEPYEIKYKRMYEESVNPFVLFNRKVLYLSYLYFSPPPPKTPPPLFSYLNILSCAGKARAL